ncbi:MAG: hypothetical protein KZQ64_07380 [gamma proteobacterium symbiont of Bathyaustriella thionipta]|nr:hypothetical protein [gamma proteobacterium symbiont of Bathyaustriella thionipta]MCU7950963.1 hypothetical protein [gamma proteobacterium symbiont of Bathyaustriella thionipta]MCU7953192.1 hypothetical protein [gamma proteobacterium symbiont of Bathyaustriella thionipta]MCU7957457.1 hypothetical protein [gamma proteobacterium symbiont of Bathyaustriella thionipta]MCU7968403.1 hypothetical protein [gamma proteobacterium symbiont of Bathyaustriella thionipta]
MSNNFGLFINLDYAHHPSEECSLLWNKIMDKMLLNGFSFQKRAFSIKTDKERIEVAKDVRGLLDEIHMEQSDFHSYIADCYILNFDNCSDLTLPDTSNSINVEDISMEELNALGVGYEVLFEKS